MKKTIFYQLLIISLFSCTNSSTKKSSSLTPAQTETFVPATNWPSFPENFVLGTPSAIGVDSHQNIFVFQRALEDAQRSKDGLIKENTVLMLDNQTGKILASWGSNQFKKPHGLTIDQNDNIWLTDVKLQQIFKFSHEGKLLMTLGEKNIPGKDDKHFDQPTDVGVSPDGSFYVTDGYGNSRVIKFSAKGKYLLEWGTKGNQKGEFNIPHAVDIDKLGNVYVADRENNRIQMFDGNGVFLKMWADPSFGSIQSIAIDKSSNTIYAVDYKLKSDGTPLGSDIIIINLPNGKITKIKHNEAPNTLPSRYHDIAIDNKRTLFTSNILLNKIHRFNKTAKQ